jgi:hypothetical protein
MLAGKQVLVDNPFIVSPHRPSHYVADFRLASRPYALSKTTVGTNTRTQFAVAWHAAAATRSAYLRKCTFQLESVNASGIFGVELHGVVSIPVTGNPDITIAALKRGGTASQVTAMALPTSAANDLGATTRIASREFIIGSTGAAPTTNPPVVVPEIVLWESAGFGGEHPTLRAGFLEGWAVIIDATIAATIKCFVRMEFWEE